MPAVVQCTKLKRPNCSDLMNFHFSLSINFPLASFSLFFVSKKRTHTLFTAILTKSCIHIAMFPVVAADVALSGWNSSQFSCSVWTVDCMKWVCAEYSGADNSHWRHDHRSVESHLVHLSVSGL